MEKLKKCSKCGRELPVSRSFGKMLQPKMDCRHIVKSAVMFMPETVRKLREGGNLKKIYLPILNWQNFLHGNLSQN